MIKRPCTKTASWILASAVASVAAGGCLTRPVLTYKPETKSVVQIPLTSTAITKVDLLFAIDNSASMADKQALLKDAVPDLISRLLSPLCIDLDNPQTVYGPSDHGACARGEPEFPPIPDLHIGIVSSSLGGIGNPNACSTTGSPHNDDRGHLVNRTDDAKARGDSPSGFLAWRPGGDANAFIGEFQDLVIGVGQDGCGFEAQEESWYRFLIQPDPYDHIDTAGGTAPAKLLGVDEELLRERREFLRPDSLVAIIQITDENESTVDPQALQGNAYWLEGGNGSAPRATAACATDPMSNDCKSCRFKDVQNKLQEYPECAKPMTDAEDWANVRFFHMKQRFGLDPMYPLSRYTLGLTAQQVQPYAGNGSCQNPLFAATLPGSANDELCKLKPNPKRGAELVFYAAITGVAGDLVPDDGNIDDAGWTKILGKDPLAYDFSSADPRMLESLDPRAGVPGDRDTKHQDLEYACTFPITPRQCAPNDNACDCADDAGGPLCDPSDPHRQVRAKAYPGVRHLALAKSLGQNGVVASICPEDTSDPSPGNARYGYRPAIRRISDKLADRLIGACLPHPPKVDETGRAPCLVLEAMNGDATDDASCDRPAQGLKRAEPAILREFRLQQRDAGNDLSGVAICEKVQLAEPQGGSCKDDPNGGWCYVRGSAALTATRHHCQEAIMFSKSGEPPSGHTMYLQCIEED